MIRILISCITLSLSVAICHAESATVVPLPIMQALQAAENYVGGNGWTAANEQQRYFLDTFYSHTQYLSRFSSKELQSWVSKNADELNAIAASRGFNIKLQPFREDEFGALSILDILLKWQQPGTKTSIRYNNQSFQAVKLPKHSTTITRTHDLADWPHPIASIYTQSQDVVHMTIAHMPLEGFALVQTIAMLQKILAGESVDTHTRYEELIFPKVALDRQEDITWLKGIATGDQWQVGQALQQTKLSMDEVGAHVESAVMVSVLTSIQPQREPMPVVIDKPFYLWIERPGCPVPILYAYIDTDCWNQG